VTLPPSTERSVSAAAEGRRLDAVVRRDGLQRSKKFIIFGMRAEPEPNDNLCDEFVNRSYQEENL
jgi:hypothetical protein